MTTSTLWSLRLALFQDGRLKPHRRPRSVVSTASPSRGSLSTRRTPARAVASCPPLDHSTICGRYDSVTFSSVHSENTAPRISMDGRDGILDSAKLPGLILCKWFLAWVDGGVSRLSLGVFIGFPRCRDGFSPNRASYRCRTDNDRSLDLRWKQWHSGKGA